MEEMNQKMNQFVKKMGKKVLKIVKAALLPILVPVLVVFLIIVILAGSVYFITIDDGTYKEGDWSSTTYGAAVYNSGTTINSDGTVKAGKTSQDIWDELKKNKSRVGEYLDNAQQLAKLMNAEVVTKYPDTRSNPDDPIDWDKIDLNGDKLQGIIKFKRADKDGNTSTLTYTEPETFEYYVREYNRSGSDKAKNFVLSHFTIEQENSSSTETASNVKVDGPELCWPVSSKFKTITSQFGYRGDVGVAGATAYHGAIDIGDAGINGTPVYACESGTVLETTNDGRI